MATQYFYDRVEIYVNGIQYLPNGQIRNFRMSARYNTKVQQGMTPTGNPAGKTIGNSMIDSMSWTELMPDLNDYVNWRTFCIANPDATFTIVPVSLSTGAQIAPDFAVTGVDPTDQTVAAPGEGDVMTRDCTFNAVTSSNL
jgi:hypothetical protein